MNKTVLKMNLIVLTIVLTILVSSEVLARECYQETANSTIGCTCPDLCMEVGGYSLSYDKIPTPQNIIDGNWDTYATPNVTNAIFYVTYFYPIGTNFTKFRIKLGTPTNLTTPNDCAYAGHVSYSFFYVGFPQSTKVSCYNSSGEHIIEVYTTNKWYEEGLYFTTPITAYYDYNDTVNEGSLQTFSMTLVSEVPFDSINISNISVGYLVYNGEYYLAQITKLNNSAYKLETSIIVPKVISDTNYTFYWDYVADFSGNVYGQSDTSAVYLSPTFTQTILNNIPLCYQETANVSTSCGGLATGSYSTSGTWTNGANTYDGNWGNYGYASSGTAYLYINYTKPIGATNLSLWQVKSGSSGTTTNLSLSDCWINDTTPTIQLRVSSTYNNVNSNFSCWNGTSWVQLLSNTGSYVYEEGIFWDMFFSGNVSYNSNVLEYTNQTFSLNLNTAGVGVTNITANLTYNGKTYPATSTHDDTTWNFTTSIIIPQVSATYNETKQFYWTYTIFYETGENVTYISFDNQIVHRLVITNLSSVGATIYTHFFKDEESTSTSVTVNTTFYFTIWSPENTGNVSTYRYYNYTETNINTKTYYLYPSWANATISVNSVVSSGSYLTREHYLCNTNVNNATPVTINQYLLKLSSAYSKIYFNLKDINQQPLPDYVLTFEKFLPSSNNYIYLGARKTDDFGQTVERIIEDNKIRIIAYNDNCIKMKEWTFILMCKEIPCTYDLTLSNLTNPFETIENIPNVAYSWNWDKESKILTLAWEDQNNPEIVQSINLKVYKRNVASDDELIFSNTVYTADGNIECNLSNYSSGDFIAKATIETSSTTFTRWYNFATMRAKEVFGKETIFLSVLLLIVLFFVGIWNPVVAIVLLLIGLVFLGIFGFVALNWLMFVLTGVVGIIIIIKLKT